MPCVPRAALDRRFGSCRGRGADMGIDLVSTCNNRFISSIIEDLRAAPAL
jgi:hypothetical protein